MKAEYPDEGTKCELDGCEGIFILPKVDNCSCHLSPPCNACVENVTQCNECGITAHEWMDANNSEVKHD